MLGDDMTPKGPFPVPQDQVNAGHDTDLPRESGSPESLDEIIDGESRVRIDPDHSIIRPGTPVNDTRNTEIMEEE